MTGRSGRLAAAIIAMVTAAGPAAAGTASISGRITDRTGAVVVNAEVRAVNLATGAELTTVSNASGLYVLAGVDAGRYRLEVASPGFRTAVRRSVVVNVGARLELDFELEVGEFTEQVDVAVRAIPIVERGMSAVSTVVDRQFVENLPLNGRSFQSLLELTPGVVIARTTPFSAGQFSVNGQRTNANYFMVDGVSANVGAGITANQSQQSAGTLPALTVLGGTNGLVSVDALEEIRVLTSTFAPEYGRSPGAQVSIVTRSGTNTFTGSAYDYVRNEALDANDWFNNRRGLAKLPLRQHNFGGVFGGPVLLPGFDGHDRTFFFFSYEGLRLRQPQTEVRSIRVPTPEVRQRASGALRDVLNAFPLPNAPALPGDPPEVARYETRSSLPSEFDSLSLRVDQRVSPKLRLFGRVNHTPSSSENRTNANNRTLFDLSTTTITVGTTWTITPSMVSQLRGNWSRSQGAQIFDGLAIDGAVMPPDSLFFPSYTNRQRASVTVGLIPAGFNATSFDIGRATGNRQRQLNLVGDLTWLRGRHEWKGGIDYRRLTPVADSREVRFNYNFGNVATALALNGPQSVTITATAPITTFYMHNFSGFLQDTWRATPRLTITYGARYEVNPPPNGDRLPYTLDGLEDPLTAVAAPPGTRQWKTTWNNIAPRIGVSYLLSEPQGLVLRGGFGVFYDLGTGTALRGYSSFPYNSNVTITTPPFPTPESLLQPRPFSTDPPYNGNFDVFQRDLKLPYTLQWNVAVERALGEHQAISITYVGAAGRRLLRREIYVNRPAIPALNQPQIVMLNPAVFPAQAFVGYTKNAGESNYRALQVQFRRRLTNGLQAMVSYTWGYSEDNSSDETASQIPGGGLSSFPVDPKIEFGRSDFDVRHSLSYTLTYDLPTPPGPTVLQALFRNWGVDLLGRSRSGLPINVISQAFDPLNIATTRRADVVPGEPVWLDDPLAPGGRRLNPAAFKEPAPGTQGNYKRNSITGFPAHQVDLSVRRTIRLAGRSRLQLRGDFFNVFNHPNFGNPEAVIGFPTFGYSSSMLGRTLGSGPTTASGFNPLYQIGGPRSVQLSARISF